ncbi:MAG: hypothetical protein JWP10_1670 [Nocardioidaceae bacterium]|nr:hypothetical protein [Nocardioidaceae bacterium]
MTEGIAWFVAALALAVALYAVVLAVRNKPVDNPLFWAVSVVEIVLVITLIGGCVALARTSRDVDGGLFASYLVTVVVIPPAAVLWGIAEKSRWGTGVVIVALLTVAVLMERTLQIWQASSV